MSAPAGALTAAQLADLAGRLPRVGLAHLPTPLEEVPRFSNALGGLRVFIKRDDCTGLAMGGNKTRHNEFILGHAIQQRADVVVWGAGVQSNNCRQTAAACAKLGLPCHLFLSRGRHGGAMQGNLLLDHLVGASITIVDAQIGPELDALMASEAERLAAQGRRPYFWNRDVVRSRAAVSYALCMAELVEQCAVKDIRPAAVYVCSAGSTGAGLVLGRAALGIDWPVRMIMPIRWPWNVPDDLAAIANQAAELLGLRVEITPADIDASDAHIGPGYGVPTPEAIEAIRLLARTEGILLDPVYTSKAMAALVADARDGRLAPGEPVIFVHTGGTPALFAYRDELVETIPPPSAGP